MMGAFSKFLEAPRVVDSLRIVGSGLLQKTASTKYTINGKPPTAEDIMARFGVDREYADAFLRRNS
jgi:hypothetical protein